ncbi:DNA polymerase III subunit beta, partial [Roseospira goensis]|uniref:DNA polymerase III subunit beta n=1 Tax=Roseospira goensis TaxID=391922 RepID=UPI0016202A90
AAKSTIPILSHVLLATRADGVTVTATDLDQWARAAIPAAVEHAGAVAVDGRLVAFARDAPAGARITLAPDRGGTRLVARSGRRRAELPCLSAAAAPAWPRGTGEGATLALGAGTLRALLDVPRPAISTEEVRHYLNGIHLWHDPDPPAGLDGDGPLLVAAATDGHRLVEAWTPAPAGAEALPPTILPRHTVPVWLKALAATAPAAPVTLTVTPSIASLTIDATGDTLASRTIDGRFPGYRRLFPDATGLPSWTVDTAAWTAAVGGLLPYGTTAEGGSTILHEAEGGTLTVSTCPATDAVAAEDAVDIDRDANGAPMRLGLNGRYVAALGSLAPRLTLAQGGDDNTPALLTPDPPDHAPRGVHRRGLIMLVRVQEGARP